jgi:hypothetical protein
LRDFADVLDNFGFLRRLGFCFGDNIDVCAGFDIGCSGQLIRLNVRRIIGNTARVQSAFIYFWLTVGFAICLYCILISIGIRSAIGLLFLGSRRFIGGAILAV